MIKSNIDQFGLSQKTIHKLTQTFSQHPKIVQAIIYDSRAKGNYHKGSDIDICIDADQMEYSEYCQLATELDDLLLPYHIDLSLKSDIDNQDLLEHIDRLGITFYEKP